ncbi:hypothetical protein FCULG_00007930 [Fusarium culmorum]|uniref:Prolyl 4-hydroxylase alpha subunit Fe(2+) 2OG dioxygenase domain-containing protein n=1 Tax=Fusarium culmorum TaxID=5516 RepID=A0A2T4H2D3_FUSCU|nr:hypothetical protein FCULG_00007930 [Fusarium culmorum]
MLLYEEGAMFKPHTDTEKIPGMFGTLVISLPSKHSGGDVVLKHCGEKMVYKSSAYSISCAAWYSDVTHEVLPITLVLTYNLAVNQSQPAPSAALRRFASQPLRHCIRRWLAQDQDSRQSPYVYHILEHEYTEANISYKTLKGPDMTRVAAIRQACNGLPVAIFLALVEKMESGSVAFAPYDLQYGDDSDTSYHHIDDVLESDLSVKITKDLDGNDPILFLTESYVPLFPYCLTVALVHQTKLDSRLVPVFKKQISAPSFRFKVLSHLIVVTVEEKLPSNESMNLCRTMARSLIESQDFALLRDARFLSAQEKKRTREPWRMGGVGIDLCRVRRELETAITHETLAKFFVSLLKVSTEIYNLTDEFMAKLIKQADKLPAVELSTMWIPFLQCSIEQMGLGSMLLTTPLYQKFFSALVLATLERYLGPEPSRPANWSVAGSTCSCADCERLSAFLAHPTQMSARFPMNKSRRYHPTGILKPPVLVAPM